ncbi:MFS transporter [Psychrobacillus psychrotolerans]|uniref:MFS transporter n=1 Tax=Psychrobacillus psychrotolerans TaxID=126156 RepID=UPI003B01F5A9
MRSKFNIVTSTILVSIFIARFGTFLVLPYLTLFLLDEFHYSGMQIGTIISTLALSNLVMSFFVGPYIDKYPKNKVIIIGLIGYLICYFYFPFIEHYSGFIAFAALLGVSQAVVEPTYRVLLSLYTEPENRRLIFNIRYFLINISAAIAPLTSVYFQQYGMTNLFFIVGFIFLLNILIFIIIFKRYPLKLNPISTTKPSIFHSFHVFKKDTGFLIFVLALIFISFGYSQFDSTFSQYLGKSFHHELAIQYFAWLITTNAITVLVIQYFVYKLGELISTTTSLMIGSGLLSMGLFFFGQSDSIIWLIAAMVIFTAGEVLVFTMVDIHLDGMCEDQEKGTYFALSGVKSVGRIVGPSLGGVLLDTMSSGALVFFIISVVTLLAIPSFYYSSKIRGQF